ncbi:cyclic pyranopterin phosphate synthase [Dehalogenimonas formicexedens]|uniref:Cyclic pyranopterin monophosphate synthase n=1 Tax=Dehalogenimonas formicexedens TaxID=1839801 RepID=A0A1P8F5Z8_9CHLR|nr:cyclic pyranopterin monophosphate synthase MoaC [Dehalogenimonas formicexedens]APV43772.1 cyclic pyranopterin phosphate synthase [Dehalogenimonas formicexedens]
MELSHVDSSGAARMVDISEKYDTVRRAVAVATLVMKPETMTAIKESTIKKGDVLSAARLAGIMAAKKTPDLIPLCHPLAISSAAIAFSFVDDITLSIRSEVVCKGATGVEMEALTAASVAALTVYDMVKAIDRGMTIENIYLESKEGGKSGKYERTG